ncbi:MAG: aldo/keto reductase [Ignavibacteriae bacterium]|nr:MAG: aldo/keto reductase [Ignavibacteriota bacterium]
MKYVQLGRTGVKVSQLCLGTMNFGYWQDEPTSYQIMDRALEHGINFFDTANVYGWDKGKGATEEIIGRWLDQGGRRDKIFLATKVYGVMADGVNDRGCSAYHIKKACEDSLRRLKTDHIDLYQMHHIDRNTPWEEVWQAMEQLVREGKILYAGSSNFAAWNMAMANERASQRHFLGLVSEQSVYSLRNRHIELEVIPAAKAYGMAVIPWSPLAGGLLCGIFSEESDTLRRKRPQLLEAAEKIRPQIEAWEQLCRDLGQDYADVALAWVRQRDGITSPIIGPRTVAQLDANVATLDITLSDETLKRLDEIWPGPGGQAPEAYAW